MFLFDKFKHVCYYIIYFIFGPHFNKLAKMGTTNISVPTYVFPSKNVFFCIHCSIIEILSQNITFDTKTHHFYTKSHQFYCKHTWAGIKMI
jgi:hypothetical protein